MNPHSGLARANSQLRRAQLLGAVSITGRSEISPEQIAKIFDPYFTTKQGKSGAGLGLYITKKVGEDHSGSIKVDSAPGVGTTITIRLPLLRS